MYEARCDKEAHHDVTSHLITHCFHLELITERPQNVLETPQASSEHKLDDICVAMCG